jgi:hypothetical protein
LLFVCVVSAFKADAFLSGTADCGRVLMPSLCRPADAEDAVSDAADSVKSGADDAKKGIKRNL